MSFQRLKIIKNLGFDNCIYKIIDTDFETDFISNDEYFEDNIIRLYEKLNYSNMEIGTALFKAMSQYCDIFHIKVFDLLFWFKLHNPEKYKKYDLEKYLVLL